MAITKPLMGRLPGRGSNGSDLVEGLAYEYRRKMGAYLRDQRLKAGMTQTDLGKLLDVGFTTVSAIELGRSTIPRSGLRLSLMPSDSTVKSLVSSYSGILTRGSTI